MKILIATSELFPYSKTGGLADMVGALATYLSEHEEVHALTPLYRSARGKVEKMLGPPRGLALTLGEKRIDALLRPLQPREGLTIWFLDIPRYYDRPSLYLENGADYPDNDERFFALCKAVVPLARTERIDVAHLHDWQTGPAALLLRHERALGWADGPRILFSIHNLAYQGLFPASSYGYLNLPWIYFQPEGVEFFGQFNSLKAGLVYADELSTVSPRYAREITTPEFGFGLDGLLRVRQHDLTGVLNGVDYGEWNTTANPHLKASYDSENMDGKAVGKAELQRELGLAIRPETPLFATITRLADQKGVDIQLPALEQALRRDVQFVLLGSGHPDYEKEFQRLAARFPGKAAVRIGYDSGLAHRIEAGCDFYLMPSKYEPCGLNQLYSLRYGSPPIVRATGGLDDSVADIREDFNAANGIKFRDYSARALVKAIEKAITLYGLPDLLGHYRYNGMTADFSWEKTALTYLDLYERLLRAK